MNKNVEFYHYGYSKATAGPSNGYANNVGSAGVVADMRCVVAHLTRNIRVFGETYPGHF